MLSENRGGLGLCHSVTCIDHIAVYNHQPSNFPPPLPPPPLHSCSAYTAALIPICDGCRSAYCISYWVIKLGNSTLTRLRNQWHFPIETTTRLQSICYSYLIKQLTRISELIFCTLGDIENMRYAQHNMPPQAHTRPHTNASKYMHKSLFFSNIHIHTSLHGHVAIHSEINKLASCLCQERTAFLSGVG